MEILAWFMPREEFESPLRQGAPETPLTVLAQNTQADTACQDSSKQDLRAEPGP